MIFNSIDFAIFLPIVFFLYWFVANRNLKLQNLFIIVSSYFFYGWWNWAFLYLILLSTIVDYSVGLVLSKEENQFNRNISLWLSIIVNLGLLGFLKYYNFFLDNFITAFSLFGTKINAGSLSIILPVGISFYTFQTLSYTIDVYKRKIKPTRDFIAFSAFVSFFPQLVAGPIERAANLLPQFLSKRIFDYSKAVDGLRQILWGLFKKIVIADNCGIYVEYVFNNSSDLPGSTLLLGAVLFSIQIYCDFSGYSDIAIGTARLFGFNLMQNFAFPYFSRDIAEFWRRWHISLSTWFRDYLYIPLGGSRCGTAKRVRNIFIIFIVSGFWHGANWTFIVWGALHAICFLPLLLSGKNRLNLAIVAKGKYFPSLTEAVHMLLTYGIVVITWIFFRAESVGHAVNYIGEIFSRSLMTIPHFIEVERFQKVTVLIIGFIFIEWLGREEQYALSVTNKMRHSFTRYFLYYMVVLSILIYGNLKANQFIYFQF